MASYYRRGNTYVVSYRLKGCRRQYIYGITTEDLAKQAKAQREFQEQATRAGVMTPDPAADKIAAARERPFDEHVLAFEEHLLAKARCVKHAKQQAAHVRRLAKMAGLRNVAEIALEPVQRALKKRHGTRCGARTCNAGRQAIIQFENWLRTTGKIRTTVLHDLTKFNEKEDVRRQRRPLTQEEVDWLLETTRNRRDTRGRPCGISPRDRAMLYATGIGTGFRQSALLSLQKSSFFVAPTCTDPSVKLAARFNKNRKPRIQGIRLDLAAQLYSWLTDKLDARALWQPHPHADLALRFRRDMEAARAAWISAAPDEAERRRREASNMLRYVFHNGEHNVYADFHGLRHTGITFVARTSGLRVAQVWADHSTPVLTARYAHVDETDLRRALAGLPDTAKASVAGGLEKDESVA